MDQQLSFIIPLLMSGKLMEDPKVLIVFTLPFVINAIKYIYNYYINYDLKTMVIKHEKNKVHSSGNHEILRAIDYFITKNKFDMNFSRCNTNIQTFYASSKFEESDIINTIGVNKWIRLTNNIEIYVEEQTNEERYSSIYTLRSINKNV